MDIFLSPHNDDEALFGAYTIMRKKPIVVVVTDSFVEEKRGDGVTAEERIQETKNACKVMGVECDFLHLRDDEITEDILHETLGNIYGVDTCYCPAFEVGGNPIHNLVARVAPVFFDCIHYMTYTGESTKTKGKTIITPTEAEKELKRKTLDCYPSQQRIKSTAPFFNNPDVLEYESYEH
jgi:LmbE family N-acetylglucosaminyl deacetylase